MSEVKEDAIKEEILKQAQNLFQQYGLKKTTMDEIASASKKAKSTLYHYFENKVEVFNAVIERELISIRKIVLSKVNSTIETKDKIITYFISFYNESMRRLNIYRIIKQELLDVSLAKLQFKKLFDYEKSFLARILEDAYDTSDFNVVSKNDIPWFSEIVVAAFFGIVLYSIETDEGIDQQKLETTAKTFIPNIIR